MAAFVARYATAFFEVVTAAKLDTAAIDRGLTDFLATWDGSRELREFFVNPAIPAVQKVEFLDTLNRKLGLWKELRNLLAVLISNDRIGAVSEVGMKSNPDRNPLRLKVAQHQDDVYLMRIDAHRLRARISQGYLWPVRERHGVAATIQMRQ